mmetsp:Transcript_1854/g.4443  ORF Transcript_1854/g.4443 Transcript_1854/m.4443 type:complete len:239 (+) Transcript_1854:728-1444(+)
MFVDPNDGSGRDSSVNIGRTIERVENSNVFFSLFDDNFLGVASSSSDQVDGNVFLFGSQDTEASGETKRSLQKIVCDYIEFFLVFSLDVDLTLVSQSLAGRKLGSLHQVSHCLAGSVDSTEKSGQFTKLGVQHSNFVHETGQSDSRGVADLVEDRNLGLRSCHGRSVDGGGVQGASTAASSRSGAESIGGRRHHEEGTEREFHCRLSSLSTKEKTTLFKIDPVSLLCVSCCWVGPSKP